VNSQPHEYAKARAFAHGVCTLGWTPGRNVEGLTESARGRGALNPQPYTLNPKVDKQAGKQAGPEEETEGEVNSRTDGFTDQRSKNVSAARRAISGDTQ